MRGIWFLHDNVKERASLVNQSAKNLPAMQEITCNAGDNGFDPWVGKIPWRRKWQSTPVFLSGKELGIEPESLTSPALAGGYLTTSITWEAQTSLWTFVNREHKCVSEIKVEPGEAPASHIWSASSNVKDIHI